MTAIDLEKVVRLDMLADHVAAITLDRPDFNNAVTPEMMRRLGALCDRCDADPGVRVVVLRGVGRWFCSGADMRSVDLSGRPGGDPPVDFRRDVYVPILRLNKPLIGCVNGAAAGGGLGLALACDLRLAADSAIFATSFTRIGIVAHDLVTWLLPRVVGIPKALELVYRPKPIDAAEALRIGLVSEVLPAAALDARVLDLAREIAGLAPRSVQASKRLILEAPYRSLEEHLMAQEYAALSNRMVAQHDIVEGTAAFAQKRKPVFRGTE